LLTVLQELNGHNRSLDSACLALRRNELHPVEAHLVRKASNQKPASSQEEVIRQVGLPAVGTGLFHGDALAQCLRSEHAQDVLDKKLRVTIGRR
jgi:hypothetical protein